MTTAAPPVLVAKPKKVGTSWLARLGPLLALIAVWALFAASAGQHFIAWDNTRLMLEQTSVIGVAALGAMLIIISGAIDLSVGSVIAMVTVATVLFINAGGGGIFGAVGGIAAGAVCGLFVALLVTKLNLNSFIVTLGMFGAVRGLAKGLANEQTIYSKTGANVTALMYTRWTPIVGTDVLKLAPGVWILLGLSVAIALMLRYTRFGRHIFAIGSNEATARLCGIRVDRTKILIWVLAMGLSGVAGVLQCANLYTTGDPTTAYGYELRAIAAVIIGGASLMGGSGTVLGTLVGAMLMTVVDNGCVKLGLHNWVQEIATGAIIIIAVFIDQLRHRRAK